MHAADSLQMKKPCRGIQPPCTDAGPPYLRTQELYQSVPVALAPVLGNPIALAAFGVDSRASWADQACSMRMACIYACIPACSVNLLMGAGGSSCCAQSSDAHSWQGRCAVSGVLFCAQAVAFTQGLVALLPQLSALAEILPPPTLEWKLQMLEEGNR